MIEHLFKFFADVFKVIFMIIFGFVGIFLWMNDTVEKDQEIRGYIAEGLALSVGAKLASIEFYEKEQHFPNDNQEAGLVEPNKIQGARVNAIEILPEGKIVIHYFGLKNDEKPQILLEAQIENGKINWTCSDNPNALDHFDQKLLPASCRE